jgi:hypothetical protein
MLTESSREVTPVFVERGNTIPLQNLYDQLSAIDNIWEAARNPTQNEHLCAAVELMNQVRLEDLGISHDFLSNLAYGQSMTIAETPNFDIAVFMLPKGFVLPLHDHPHMIVCSKLLLGDAHIRSFSPMAINDHGDIKAQLETDLKKSAIDSAWMLTPKLGNIHEITPVTDCVMLDILLPPYNDRHRPCKFYHAKVLDEKSGCYVLRSLPMHYIQRIPLPLLIPYVGYRPSSS